MNITNTTVLESVRSKNKPSLYADPLAWAIADFAESFVTSYDSEDRKNIGLIIVSDYCSLATMSGLSKTMVDGKLSPLKFAGANPGVVCGIAAIEHSLRGPSIVFTMPPKHAAEVMKATSSMWMQRSSVHGALLITHQRLANGQEYLAGTFLERNNTLTAECLSVLCETPAEPV
ncbi:hypothetical protein [Azorhizophilus paspali]|uniref:Uncharacterized protein n=1 Tax=Azorhizophilus paspali TaxID=69963 RepID=A0ABV6SK01_AZOPA